MCFYTSQYKQTCRHDSHAKYDPCNTTMMVAVFFSSREQFIKGDINHYSGYESEYKRIQGIGPY